MLLLSKHVNEKYFLFYVTHQDGFYWQFLNLLFDRFEYYNNMNFIIIMIVYYMHIACVQSTLNIYLQKLYFETLLSLKKTV